VTSVSCIAKLSLIFGPSSVKMLDGPSTALLCAMRTQCVKIRMTKSEIRIEKPDMRNAKSET